MATGNGQQRTAQERERARQEREARRGRGGERGRPEATAVAQDPPAGGPEPAIDRAPEVEPASAVEPASTVELASTVAPASAVEPASAVAPAGAGRAVEPASAVEPAGFEPASALEPEVEPASDAEPLHTIPVKLPRPASLPPRIAPLQPPAPRSHWPARGRVAALLLVVVAVLGALVAFVLLRSKPKPPPVAPIAVVTVAIPEGETAAQIAQIAAAKGLTGSYAKASRHSTLLDPAHYGAPADTSTLEGFLFPATYEMYARAPVARLVAAQLVAFEENFGAPQARRARALHVTPYQMLIVASMVEREALLESDRPKVAAVIYNRLRLGMPLGIDSTIRYALHDFSKPLTEAQLHIDSPYNTRTHRGLPPTPISNPGAAAIDAAAHPARVSYLYYVNGADGCGELEFSTGYAEFERNAAAYQQAIARNGGRVPACRKR